MFHGSEGSGHDSRMSASELGGGIKTERPTCMLFGEDECRRQVTPCKSDGELMRVCGNKAGQCTRSHVGVVRFGAGVNETIADKGNRFIDGVAGSCISAAEFEELMSKELSCRTWKEHCGSWSDSGKA
jgi:hypothetical protein